VTGTITRTSGVKFVTRYAPVLIVAASTLVHFWAAGRVGLVADETYYWLWSRFPSFGYYDHPPMVAWLIAGGTELFGDTALGIRSLFVVILPIISLVIYQTARLLFDNLAVASLATIWFNASLLSGVGGIFASPDAPSVLFWSLAVLALVLVWRTGHSAWWLAVGAAAGLGAISKYTNLFFGLGVLAWIIVDTRERRWLLDPWAWAGALLAFLIFLPVIIWNSDHHWGSFAKQFGRIVPHGASLRFVLEFVLAQIGLINPAIAVFAGIGIVAGLRHWQAPEERQIRFLLALAAPLVLYMFLHSFHNRVEGNWLAPIYPTFALIAAVAAVSPTERADESKRLRRLKAVATPLGLTLSALGLLYLTVPLTLLGAWDPSRLTRGWPQFSNEVDTVGRAMNADWIATTSYQLTAELAFHLRSKSLVQEIGERERYSFEPPLEFASLGKRALFVVPIKHKLSNTNQNCFENVTPIGSIERVAGQHVIKAYRVYLAVTPTPSLVEGRCTIAREKD
jgi:4-amino-4-deoxy-L-arabinose transferase-like glycosyltransferase